MSFEPYTEDAHEPPAARGFVLLTVQRDGDVAAEWHEALLRADVDAEMHIQDAASFSPTSSAYPTGDPFVYALFVHGAERERAANVLIDLGWDGRGIARNGAMRLPTAAALRGASLALAASLALVVVLILLRGG